MEYCFDQLYLFLLSNSTKENFFELKHFLLAYVKNYKTQFSNMRTLFCLVGILLLSSFKKDKAPVREWTRYNIDYEDFRASADKKSNFDAVTECGIKYEMYIEEDSAYIRIVAVLNRHKSWIKDKSPEVLNHEQGHFNICERSVRMFRKRIYTYEEQLTTKNIESVMNQLLDEATESNRLNQNMYENSVEDERVQQYWDRLIVEDIDKLEAFSGSLIVIGLKDQQLTSLK